MCIWRFLLHSSSCFYRNGPYPLEIQFQMRLMDIFEINPTDFSIVVSVYFSFRWTENRLILNTNKSYISLDLEFIKNLWVYEQGCPHFFDKRATFNPFRPNRFDHYFYALSVEKQHIYKLTSRHRVPR